jgi:dTDP-4-amino-4,6-dideoxy-D-galactose acyltransferase
MKLTDNLQDQNKIRSEVFELLDEKKAELSVYSPFSFLHNIEINILSDETFIKPLRHDISAGLCKIQDINIEGYKHFFIFRNLVWDSEYFKRRVNRIDLILFDHRRINIVSRAVNRFIAENILHDDYFFINVPCEDLTLLQGLSYTGFRLIETRLNYYFSDFQTAEPTEHPVRRADNKDIPVLRDIAIRMRNKYDRVHADSTFSAEQSDAYLGTFIEESVKGFADMVIIPDISGSEPFGFLAANNPKKILGHNIAKLVLAAVDNTIHRGWLYHLLVGVIYELRKQETNFLTTITQASNRSAVRTWEKAGFRLGFVTHVFSVCRL